MALGFLCLTPAYCQENLWSSDRPDGHAPISIMGDHMHKKGELMFSYRFMSMQMDGMLAEDKSVSTEEVHSAFMVAPEKMTMQMHMLGAMYAVSDQLTIMAMANYLQNDMGLQTRMNREFKTTSSGLGDVSLSALINLRNQNRKRWLAIAGVSLPTGDIDQRDDTPMRGNAPLAYPMQLGSGTVDPFAGLTFLGQANRFSWGAQGRYQLRIGENQEAYRFGNLIQAKGWGSYYLGESSSLSLSANYWMIDQIDGMDEDLNPMMMPLFDATNSGRAQVDIGLGSNFYISEGAFKNLRTGAEFLVPVWQNVQGLQMENSWMLVLGMQYSL